MVDAMFISFAASDVPKLPLPLRLPAVPLALPRVLWLLGFVLLLLLLLLQMEANKPLEPALAKPTKSDEFRVSFMNESSMSCTSEFTTSASTDRGGIGVSFIPLLASDAADTEVLTVCALGS